MWGAGTSSYQVEGGITNNDWDYFTREEQIKQRIHRMTKPNIFFNGYDHAISLVNAGNASRSWEPTHYLMDFDLAKSLGMNAFRISLEWSRIEPQSGEWDENALFHYREMIGSMKKRGLTPIVTLNHLTLPKWVLLPPSRFEKKVYQFFLPTPFRDLPMGDPVSDDLFWKSQRGWENYHTVEAFIEYVKKVIFYLKDEVDYWITIGEPVASILGGGYLAGIYPPGFFLDGKRTMMALHNLIEAHIQAYDVITAIDNIDSDSDGESERVGIAHFMAAVSPAKSHRLFKFVPDANIEAANNFSYFINDYFLNAIINGEEDLNYLTTLQKSNRESKDFIVHKHWKNKADFIGLNYYRHLQVYNNRIISTSSARFVGGFFLNGLNNKHQIQHSIVNDLGWEIYPQGLYDIIMRIKRKWNKEILITENGIADSLDRLRAPFIIAHLQQVKRAIDAGAEILGYIHWSLVDNYEWHEGYKPQAKFGLFTIDYNKALNNNILDRNVTKGAQALKLIIEKSCSENKHGVVTDAALSQARDIYGSFMPDGSRIV
jgi:beta-glucosidase